MQDDTVRGVLNQTSAEDIQQQQNKGGKDKKIKDKNESNFQDDLTNLHMQVSVAVT